MLYITVPGVDAFNESTGEFITIKETKLALEHSLVSVSKWESFTSKPFLQNDPPKTTDELLLYIKCMTITQNVDPMVYSVLTDQNIKDINKYIESPMTATTIYDQSTGRGGKRQIITSEIIYYWMISYNIPFECQKWHLNRLLTLINVLSIKNAPPKKMSRSEALSRQRAMNKARRQTLGTKG